MIGQYWYGGCMVAEAYTENYHLTSSMKIPLILSMAGSGTLLSHAIETYLLHLLPMHLLPFHSSGGLNDSILEVGHNS